MKRLFIIYNILFLLAGNILFSNVHVHLQHDHSDEHETHECQQCLLLENSNNYILDFEEAVFSSYNSGKFTSKKIVFISLDRNKKYLSRAPPTFK
tara:strand:- start:27 stop:311 length:285 start_codon:yes stop_codon:yes gene_type:complete